MSSQREKDVLSEFIELYRDLPCLWDLSSEEYKDASQKKIAWGILAEKLKDLDPNANELSAKKKVDHLKYSYQREVKKVKESKNRTGSAASEVYHPNLWYFEHLSFLEKKSTVKRTGVDNLMEEDEIELTTKKKKQTKDDILEVKKHKLLDTAQALINQSEVKISSFGTYVGEKLEKIAPGQREIAEKLISDVLFLGQTNSLRFNSRIDTPSFNQDPEYNSRPYVTNSPHSSSDASTDHYPPYMLHTNSRRFSPFAHSPPPPLVHRQQPRSYHSFQIQAASPSPNSALQIQSPPPSADIQHPHPPTSYSTYQTSLPVASQSSQGQQSQPSPSSYQIPHQAPSPSANPTLHIQSPPPTTPHPPTSYSTYQISLPVASQSSQGQQSQPSPSSYQIPHPALSPSANPTLHIQSPPPTTPHPPTPYSTYQTPHSVAQPSPSSNIIHSQLPPPDINDNQAVFYADGPSGEILKEMLIFKKNI